MRLRNKINWRRGRGGKRRTSVNVKNDSFFSFSGARVSSLPLGLESLPGSSSDDPFSGQFSCSGLENIELCEETAKMPLFNTKRNRCDESIGRQGYQTTDAHGQADCALFEVDQEPNYGRLSTMY